MILQEKNTFDNIDKWITDLKLILLDGNMALTKVMMKHM